MTHTVAVVTRTHNRTVFLRRVLACVASQTHQDLVHIVVNDAGDPDAVAACIAQLPEEARRRVQQVDNSVSAGREAAVNPGFSRAGEIGADFVLVLDDDDTIAENFLEEAVAHLKSHPEDVGVACLVEVVRERVDGDDVEELGRFPLTDGRRQVTLFELLKNNFVPPVSLLFRASALERLGGWREDLPVLADWDFNLRLAMLGRIGQVGQKLACWHHREAAQGDLGNSVVIEADNHRDYALLIRDDYLRRLGMPEQPLAGEGGLALPLLIGGSVQEVLTGIEDARASSSAHLEAVLVRLSEQLNDIRQRVDVVDVRQRDIEHILNRLRDVFDPRRWVKRAQRAEPRSEPPSL